MEEEESGEGRGASGDVGDAGVGGDGDVFVNGWIGQGVRSGHDVFILIQVVDWERFGMIIL